MDNIKEIYKVDNLNLVDKKMKDVMDIIEMNPSVLEKLSLRKLKIIDNYYSEKIKEYKKKLENM